MKPGEQTRQQAQAVQRRSAAFVEIAESVVIARELIAAPLTIRQIARRLAKVNRFAGNTKYFYSVAQHSVLVSEACAPDCDAMLYGLLHDAHEAKLSDIPAPFAALMAHHAGCDVVGMVKASIDATLLSALDIAPPSPEIIAAVASADAAVFAAEVRDIVEDADRPWKLSAGPRAQAIGKCWPWLEAEERFLSSYKRLREVIP